MNYLFLQSSAKKLFCLLVAGAVLSVGGITAFADEKDSIGETPINDVILDFDASDINANDFDGKNETADSADEVEGTLDVPLTGIKGDVDGDGEITSGDALKILRHSISLEKLHSKLIPFADMDGDGIVTSNDALEALRKYVDLTQPIISFPSKLAVHCGDRIDIEAKMTPAEIYSDIEFEYVLGKDLSDDGLTDAYGNSYRVLDYTNTGRIKAFHPGTSTITAIASNGMKAVCTVTVSDVVTEKTISSGNTSLKITTHMMTYNDCYNEEEDFTDLQGVVVHSTATPGVYAARWYDLWNKPATDVAVHSFLDDKGVYNYLPYDQIGWHAGSPANQNYLDFEICEPGGFSYVNNIVTDYDVNEHQEYFDTIWANAALYTAYLCSMNGLTEQNVISHGEAGRMGIGTNHGDPDHWFVLHNRTMDDFRNEVAKYLALGITESDPKIIG